MYLADGSMSSFLAGDLDQAERLAAAAYALGERTGNWFATCESLDTMAGVHQSRGRPAEALDHARRSVALSSGRMASTGGRPMPHLHLASALVDLDRLDDDLAIATGLDLCHRDRSEGQIAWYLGFRALVRFLSGRWDQARDDARATLDAAEASGAFVTQPLGWGILAVVEAFRGNDAAARAVLDVPGSHRLGVFGGFAEDWVLLARGAVSHDVRTQYQAFQEAWFHSRQQPWFITWRITAPVLVRTALLNDDRHTAEMVTVQAAEGARLCGGLPSAAGTALRCEALLRSDPEAMDAAVEAYAESGRPFSQAHACFDAARLWVAVGETGKGLRHLATAAELYTGMRATPWMARVGRMIAELSGPGPAPPRPDPMATLTRAERAVAQLAAEGMTNPEIAAELVLSARTVQTHLSHVYVKLGLSSRVQLARLAASGDGPAVGAD
jgi:DNA-binding NarL/FixJ family response regulator